VSVSLEEAAAVYERRRTAWLAEDLEAYLACFAEDVVLETPNRTVHGHAEYEPMARQSFAWAKPVSFEGFLDAKQSQIGPHQLIELAQAWVSGGGIGGSHGVIGAGGFNVATDLAQAAVALAAVGRKRTYQDIAALQELGDLLSFAGLFGGIVPAIDPTTKKGQVRHINPAQDVSRQADDQAQQLRAKKTQAQSQQSQGCMMRALKKLSVIVWSLIWHQCAYAVSELSIVSYFHP
jgi:hypothetical protein